MKKLINILFFTLFVSVTANSQSHYVFIDFKDAQKPAIQNEFSYPEKTVNDAIQDRLNKMGYKGKDVKGYTVYRGVVLPELGNQPYDLYFKVDRKSRKDKDVSIVNMMISTGNENFISDSSDSRTINNAKNFLDNLKTSIAAYDLQQLVNTQGDALTKAEKKLKSLQNDADDLQKRRKKLEQQIEDNQKAQKDQQSEVEKQRQLFESIKSRQN